MTILFDNKKMGPKHGKYYTEWMEVAYPRYLHDVYHCALKAVSVEAAWSEIALAMNADSTRINDKPNLEICQNGSCVLGSKPTTEKSKNNFCDQF
jgi:hypothetical protein